jgi:hypothetical protein
MDIFIQQYLSKLWLVAHIYDKAKYCGYKLNIVDNSRRWCQGDIANNGRVSK